MGLRTRLACIAGIWIVIAILGGVGAGLPFALGMDLASAVSRRGGGLPAAVVCGGLVAVYALITAVRYVAQADALESLLAHEDPLLRWSYGKTVARSRTVSVCREDRLASWVDLSIVLLCSLLHVIEVAGQSPDAGRLVLIGVAGVAALLATATFLVGRRRVARRGTPPEALVSREAAYVLGELHPWKLMGARVKAARVTEESTPGLLVEYLLPWPARWFGRTRAVRTIVIPIPPGEEERARAAARAIMEPAHYGGSERDRR